MNTIAASVLRLVCAHFGYSINELLSKQRTGRLAWARACTCRLLRVERFSFPEIGLELGGKDHTTIMAACRRVERHVEAGDRRGIEYLELLEAWKATRGRLVFSIRFRPCRQVQEVCS